MLNVTLSQLLSDLRFVSEQPIDYLVRASTLDHDGAHLTGLGWASRLASGQLLVTALGCDILHACVDVALDEAA